MSAPGARPAPPLLLASTSPQRRAILEQLGIPEAPLRLELARAPEYMRMGTRVRKGPLLFQKIDVNATQL